jgi:hypothetical protein
MTLFIVGCLDLDLDFDVFDFSIRDLYWVTTLDIDANVYTKLVSNREELGSARYVGSDDRILINKGGSFSLYNPADSVNVGLGHTYDWGLDNENFSFSHEMQCFTYMREGKIQYKYLNEVNAHTQEIETTGVVMYPFFSFNDTEIVYSRRVDGIRSLVAYNLSTHSERIIFENERYALINGMYISPNIIICKEYEYGRNSVSGRLALLNDETGTYEIITNEEAAFFDYSQESNRVAYLTSSSELVVLDLDSRAEIYRQDIVQHVEYTIYPTFNHDGTKICVDNYIIDLDTKQVRMINLKYLTQPSMNYNFTKSVGLTEADLDHITKGDQ